MKKLFMLFAIAGLFIVSCNNNKDKNGSNTNNREKDDYSNNKDKERDDNSSDKWSSGDIKTFNSDCRREMSEKIEADQLDQFCACLLDKFQDKFSSLAVFNKESTEEDGRSAGQDCKAQLTGNNNNNNTESGWTSSEEQLFMNDCERDASKTVEPSQAKRYCDCMLQKIKGLFPTYASADKGLTEDDMTKMAVDCVR